MDEIVNLRRARKRRARAEAGALAAENRVRHGRTGAQKQMDRTAEERRRATLDGKRRDDEPDPR